MELVIVFVCECNVLAGIGVKRKKSTEHIHTHTPTKKNTGYRRQNSKPKWNKYKRLINRDFFFAKNKVNRLSVSHLVSANYAGAFHWDTAVSKAKEKGPKYVSAFFLARSVYPRKNNKIAVYIDYLIYVRPDTFHVLTFEIMHRAYAFTHDTWFSGFQDRFSEMDLLEIRLR